MSLKDKESGLSVIVVECIVFLTFQVKITFEEPEPGVTVVNLTHTDVPEEDRLGTLI